MSKNNKRIGETRMQNCGMEATIIKYDRCKNITVRFADGTEIKNRQYNGFLKGTINNPNYKSYIGETKMMNCGMEATIIDGKDKMHITVKFIDGTVIKNRRYDDFQNGKINNPNYKPYIGETRIMNCGIEATIIDGKDKTHITVKFTDGTIIKNRQYSNFKKGNIDNPNYKPHLNETKMQNCGMRATIIEWFNYKNITVRFTDGTIIKNRTYSQFKKGNMDNPNYKSHLGETKMQNCGMEATIIEWFNTYNIIVKFTDGTIIKNRTYSQFKKGSIDNPNIINHFDPFGNGFHTMIEMCRYHNISYQLYRERVHKCKWPIKDALTVPKNMSLGEYKIKEYLERKQIKYKYNKTLKTIFKEFKLDVPWEEFIDVLYNDLKSKGITTWSKETISKLKPDFVLYKDKNNKIIGIAEFDGKQHFGLIEYFIKTVQQFIYRCDCDVAKNKFFEFMSLPLLRIRYDQVDLIEPILDDFLAHPEEYISKKHNPYLTEEEYWAELYNTFKKLDNDDLGYNPS